MFYQGISTPRNKSLIRILSDLDYVEQTGHGIPDVVKIYGKEIFVIHDTYVNVKIPFNKDVLRSHNKESIVKNVTSDVTMNVTSDEEHDLSNTDIIILNEIKLNPKTNRKEISEKINKTVRTVQRSLNKLKQKNIIKRIGSKNNCSWIVIDNKETMDK